MQTSTMEKLNFDSALGSVILLREAASCAISERSVVINLAATDASTGTAQQAALPPLSSTIIEYGNVTGELLLVIGVREVDGAEQVARNLGWLDFYGETGPVLLKSPQHEIGEVKLDRRDILHQKDLPGSSESFAVKANLWFSPAGTDCGIHRVHPFIEVHTQISGLGRMQKFDEKDHSSLYEDQQLSPGNTNPIPFCVDNNGEFEYPWHQYRADTNCIWLALEYHPV